MSVFSTIFALVGPHTNGDARAPELSPAQRGLVTVSALLGALGLVAVWGLVANPTGIGISLRNSLTVPMLFLVSAIVCLPAIIVVSRLFVHTPGQTTTLLLGYALGAFGGALTLAATSPVVALYYHSSRVGGPLAAKASLVLGIAIGVLVFIRAGTRLTREDPSGSFRPNATRWVIGSVLIVSQLAVIAQLASTVDPIFAKRTRFGEGIDGLVLPRSEQGVTSRSVEEHPHDEAQGGIR